MKIQALGSGFILALTTSGGLLGARLHGGDAISAALANAAATIAALAVLALLLRAGRAKTPVPFGAQLGGVAAGVAVVHLAIRAGIVGAPWLAERPAQLVNDAALAGMLLLVVRGSADRLDPRALVAALLVASAYRATAPRWHLDHAAFQTTVQQLVVMELVAVALALAVFRAMLERGRA